jgi:hypothetical protein
VDICVENGLLWDAIDIVPESNPNRHSLHTDTIWVPGTWRIMRTEIVRDNNIVRDDLPPYLVIYFVDSMLYFINPKEE